MACCRGVSRSGSLGHDCTGNSGPRAEALTGITMASIRSFPGPDDSAITGRLPPLLGSRVGQRRWRGLRQRRWAARVRRALAGPGMTLLTSRELFTQISYADPVTALAYPPAPALAVTAAGRLDTTIWHQELKVGDLLIRDTATVHPSRRPATSSPATWPSCSPTAAGTTPSPSPSTATNPGQRQTAGNPAQARLAQHLPATRMKPCPRRRTRLRSAHIHRCPPANLQAQRYTRTNPNPMTKVKI